MEISVLTTNRDRPSVGVAEPSRDSALVLDRNHTEYSVVVIVRGRGVTPLGVRELLLTPMGLVGLFLFTLVFATTANILFHINHLNFISMSCPSSHHKQCH